LETRIPADLEYSPSATANELLTLAAAKLSLGRAAEAEAERALGLSKADATLFGAARIHLAAGNEKKARALAAELGGRRVREPQAYAKIIEGEAQLIRGDSRGAIQTLREAQQILDTWIGHYVLGRAYLDDGAWLEAHEEFGICLKRRGEASAISVDEVPSFRYLPAVYYYLGRAQERLKSPAAAESYRAFVSIKENAEGAEPLVEDARRRIAAR
jgi:tetratricopeptide (TPR) repeat protein